MNFLAHLYLAHDSPGGLIGSLAPDLVRGRSLEGLAADVAAGVARHRRVDVFTDRHPAFQRSRARLRGRQGIFSPILVDLFYDHFLSVRWEEFHRDPLPLFVAHVYRTFELHVELIPAAMRPIVERMASQDWLSTYASFDGLGRTLSRMSRRFEARFQKPIDLAGALDSLRDEYHHLGADFAAFFPDLVAFVDQDPPGART